MQVEFSRPLKIDHIDRKGNRESISANTDECAALARRFDIASVENLTAELSIKPMADKLTYEVTGTLTAIVTQNSIISGTPVTKDVTNDIEAWFINNEKITSFSAAKKRLEDEDMEREVLNERDDPDPIENGIIDLGEVAAQFLGLALDDYPRTENESDGAGDYIEATSEDTKPNPFAVLAKLKKE